MKAIAEKKEIIKQLKEKILAMERPGMGEGSQKLDFGLGPMTAAFPGGVFPVGAIHEFISPTETCAAAANGVLAGLLSSLMEKGGLCLWIGADRRLFPPTLKFFGVEPHRVIFIDVRQERDVLWVMEQGLKCDALAAVVAELQNVNFAESRRLQLAVESSRVTGFIHRYRPLVENALACVSRWKVRPLPGRINEGLPGVGFSRVEINLEKVRNGKPGIWQLEWRNGTFASLKEPRKTAPAADFAQTERNYA
ncbi:ImuA family protein [Sunxiuqinia sp. sy24]|uniref:ImuA family protein n=1 Tax=Sunxiuqinia sp. sy24 TaxID=3461495 RepID=UPI0040464A87